jgi:hypothetical protein
LDCLASHGYMYGEGGREREREVGWSTGRPHHKRQNPPKNGTNSGRHTRTHARRPLGTNLELCAGGGALEAAHDGRVLLRRTQAVLLRLGAYMGREQGLLLCGGLLAGQSVRVSWGLAQGGGG